MIVSLLVLVVVRLIGKAADLSRRLANKYSPQLLFKKFELTLSVALVYTRQMKFITLLSLFICSSTLAMGQSPQPASPDQWICRWRAGSSASDPSHGRYPGTVSEQGCGADYRDSRDAAREAAMSDCQGNSRVLEETCQITRCTQGLDPFCG